MDHSHLRKIIIVRHDCALFANRLWSDMSIHALALETGAKVNNHTFFEHTLLRPLHSLYWRIIRSQHPTCSVWAWSSWKILPPSRVLDPKYNSSSRLCFFGWLYRNPDGLKKFRKELLELYGPTASEEKILQTKLASFQGKTLIGITLRQKPFLNFPGEFIVSPARVRTILDDYVKAEGLSKEKVALVVVSDLAIPPGTFAGFETHEAREDERTQFFLLSKCTVIIGTNATFANLAAWFANAPHIVETNEPIDWGYYRNKNAYFENKYATFAFGSVTLP